jgi:hypothetical protein
VAGWQECQYYPGAGLFARYRGTAWTELTGHGLDNYGDIYDISGTSRTSVFAIGTDAAYGAEPGEGWRRYVVLHYDGSATSQSIAFTYREGEPMYRLNGVWAGAPGDVFVVGDKGRVLHYDGTEWSSMPAPTTSNLLDVWGASANEVYAVGDGGILRYNGHAWRIIRSAPASALWGTASALFVIAQRSILFGSR